LGELTAILRPSSWIKRAYFEEEERERDGKREKGEGRDGKR